MKLILVRHGETVGNYQEIVQGSIESELTEKGKFQAKKLGERFKDIEVDAVLCSDLKRAVETAKEIAKYHPGAEFRTLSLIRERNYGIFEGQHISVYRKAKGEYSKYDYNHPSCEHCDDVERRAEDFLEMLKKEYNGKTVVAVAHGGFNRYVIGSAIKLPRGERHRIFQSNTCVNIIEQENDFLILKLLNCQKHLA